MNAMAFRLELERRLTSSTASGRVWVAFTGDEENGRKCGMSQDSVMEYTHKRVASLWAQLRRVLTLRYPLDDPSAVDSELESARQAWTGIRDSLAERGYVRPKQIEEAYNPILVLNSRWQALGIIGTDLEERFLVDALVRLALPRLHPADEFITITTYRLTDTLIDLRGINDELSVNHASGNPVGDEALRHDNLNEYLSFLQKHDPDPDRDVEGFRLRYLDRYEALIGKAREALAVGDALVAALQPGPEA
jgi:hypothetical protein